MKFRLVKAILEQIDKERPKNVDQVIVPFASEIESKLPDEVEIRSKLPQFVKLIQSIALVKALCLNGYNTVKTEKMSIRVVIATLEDFQDALFLAGPSFFHMLPATSQAILDFLASRIEGEGDKEAYAKCTVRQIQEKLKLHVSTINKYAKQLADMGLIDREDTTKEGTNVKLCLYQYKPNTIIDTGLDLNEFDFQAWKKTAIDDMGFVLEELKLETPLELELLTQKEHTFFSCVNIGVAPIITHEKKIPSFQPKTTIEPSKVMDSTNPKGYCSKCDTEYGDLNVYHEHIKMMHDSADSEVEGE